jgi:hypothetical protein
MSALNGLAVNGSIPTGAGPVVSWRNGLPFNAAGRLVVTASAPDHWSGGIGFEAASAVSLAVGGTPTEWVNGVPFTGNGHLCGDAGPVDHWSSGVPFSVDGRIVVS